jgi:hypothetical protein
MDYKKAHERSEQMVEQAYELAEKNCDTTGMSHDLARRCINAYVVGVLKTEIASLLERECKHVKAI